MTATALEFQTNQELCLFLKESNLRRFLLLGKKNILVAEFPSEILSLALNQFQASPVQIPETEIFQGQKVSKMKDVSDGVTA